MDGKRFDTITKSFATPQTRRGVLKKLGAGLASGLAALGLGSASAKPGGQGNGNGNQGGNRCGGPGQPCKWNRQCCSFAGLVCLNGACTECPGGSNYCPGSGVCVDACPAGQVFDTGSCSCACPAGSTLCGGACIATCGPGEALNTTTCNCDCVPTTCCHCRDADEEVALCTDGVATRAECDDICIPEGWDPVFAGELPGHWVCGGVPGDPQCNALCYVD